MRKVLLTYTLAKQREPLALTRKIYGYIDSSNHAQYSYVRKGILSNYSYEKIARATLFINPQDKTSIVRALKRMGLRIKTFDVTVH